jgi:hypothetical protein
LIVPAKPQGQQIVLGHSFTATIFVTFGLPSVSVPVLSTTSVSTFSIRSRASAFLIKTPSLRAAPHANHDRHRRGQTKGAGQAMIRTLTAAINP